MPARRLELEITETLLLEKSSQVLATLHALRALGVRISMDDFGTGYSSLSYLRSFPFDKIKIDRSFVQEVDANRDAQAIIRSIVSLGKGLGVTITAEGVETEAELSCLRAEGCHEGQGFLFSRARPNAEIVALLRAQRGLIAAGSDAAAAQNLSASSLRGANGSANARPMTAPRQAIQLAYRGSWIASLARNDGETSFPFPQMIRQRQPHAVAQFGLRQFLVRIEQDGAVAAVAELWIEIAKGFDEISLAVEEHGNLVLVRFHPVDPDGAAAAGLASSGSSAVPISRLLRSAPTPLVDLAVSKISRRRASSFALTGFGQASNTASTCSAGCRGRPRARARLRTISFSRPGHFAPFRLQAVAHVVVTPRSHLMQAAMHCSLSLGLYDGNMSVAHLETGVGVESGQQAAVRQASSKAMANPNNLGKAAALPILRSPCRREPNSRRFAATGQSKGVARSAEEGLFRLSAR